MPPERLSKKRTEQPIRYSVDYWALGIILYELFTGETPYNGDSEEEVLEQIYEGYLRNKEIPKAAMELISSILHWSPEKRTTL
jgi:serine/threonine protein kinase